MRFFLFIVFFYSGILFSQPEFAPLGARWNYELIYHQWFPPVFTSYSPYQIEVKKDTIIGPYRYKILQREPALFLILQMLAGYN